MVRQTLQADLCVIGAGSGGLSVAAGAAQMGAKVVLIEKHKMGGDCLNTGCVPSKALLAAAHAAQTVRTSGRFGVNGHEPEIDFAAVRRHVEGVIEGIAPHDSVERFEGLGVTVIRAAGHFTGPDEVVAGDARIKARRFVIATGSSPAVPRLPGLDGVPFLTNETVFDLDERPDHLIVLGGGPIGVELAQAHRRLGVRVTLLEAFTILGKDDSEAVEVVRRRLLAEGIELRENAKISAVEPQGNGLAVILEDEDGAARPVAGSHLLVAAGRRPNIDGLGLTAAAVEATPKGILVDRRLRTSNKRVFAIGDVAGGYQFTHMAAYQAGIVLRNALFRLPAKVGYDAVPWVTYSDPELAQVGLTEAEAHKHHDGVKAVRWRFADNDRARAEGETEGLVKAVTGRGGRILGATIVGRSAGELILPWVLAIGQGLKIGAMAQVIAPYPTLSEASKRAAGSSFAPALFGERTRKAVRFLQRFG